MRKENIYYVTLNDFPVTMYINEFIFECTSHKSCSEIVLLYIKTIYRSYMNIKRALQGYACMCVCENDQSGVCKEDKHVTERYMGLQESTGRPRYLIPH